MKRNAIVRIILYSMAILVLTGILLAGLGFGTLEFDIDMDDTEYISGSGSLNAESIRNLNVEWAAGSIRIISDNTDAISFSDTGSSANPLVYTLEGDTLTIRYEKPRVAIGFFSDAPKDLTITVPRFWMCSNLSVETAAAELYAYCLYVESFELDSASGECEFDSCDISHLEIDTASGAILYNDDLDTLDLDAASADFMGILKNNPQWIRVDSASGDLDLTLPAGCGFQVSMDTMSGKFVSDFDTYYYANDYYYGDKSCKIDFNSASGNAIIREG